MLFKHREMFFDSLVYIIYIYASDVKFAHAHINVLFWDVMYFGLRGELRVNINHMITLELFEFSFICH